MATPPSSFGDSAISSSFGDAPVAQESKGFGQGLWDSTLGGLGHTAKALFEAAGDSSGIKAYALVKGLYDSQKDMFDKARAAYSAPGKTTGQQIAGAAGYGLAGAIPLLGPAAANIGENFVKDPHYAAGQALGTALSIAAPEAIKAIPGSGMAADSLRAGAETDYAKALRPTRLATKAQVQNTVAPGLAERGVVAPSLNALRGQAQSIMDEAAGSIDDFFDQAAQSGAKQDVMPIINKLKQYQQKLTVNGQDFNPEATKAISDATDKLVKAADPQTGEIDLGDLRRIRQIYDQRLQNVKPWALDANQSSALEAQRQVPNAIRSEFANQYPDLADANADFHFGKSLDDVIAQTQNRTQGQMPSLTKQVAGMTGAAIGAHGGPIPAAITSAAFRELAGFRNSIAYRSLSAQTKMQAAKLIESGDPSGALKVLRAGAVSGQSSNTAPDALPAAPQ